MASNPYFARGSYTAKSPIASAERTINWIPEIQDLETPKPRGILLPTPGFTQFGTTLVGAFRGAFTTANRTFAVVGGKWYEFASTGTETDRSTVPVSTADNLPATLAANGAGGNQIFFSASGRGYNYDLGTNVLTEVLASGCTMVASLDGFFISLNAATSTIRISDNFAGLTWPATQIYQRTAQGDKWVSLLVSDVYIWLIGELTSERFFNSGASPFPFEADPAVLPVGTPAAYSPADANSSVIFLAQNADGLVGVVQVEGLSVRKISTLALDVAIASYATISDAIGETYAEEGHTFYLLTFPTAGVTWCYDLTTRMWHERGFWNTGTNAYEAIKPMFHTFNVSFGKHLWGDRTTAKFWRASTTLSTDVDGNGTRRLRRFPSLYAENRLLFFDGLEIVLESGLGIIGQADPLLELMYANDGGKNFDNAGFVSAGQRSSGATGEYLKRVRWRQLGSGRQRVWQVVSSAAVPFRLIEAVEDLRPGLEVR